MTSRIWQLAGVGLLGLGISLGALAEGPGDPGPGRPLNARDEVRQTQPPRQGYYQDIPRRHGNGWGPGPQYRPGHTVDRFPDRYWTVPYRGHDYFYSGGYWYRPHGGNYIVVTPPYGVRVNYLPPYAREVWVGGALFFLVADTYYQYLADSQEYVVVNPPAVAPPPAPPPPVAGGYDVVAYPMYGQGPEQQEQDRYQCHRWAVSQSGFDPATATYAPPPNVLSNYQRALGACFSGRGYSVN
ncbi:MULTISPECIES: DUF6515 family protein [Pseudomonas]|uniref:DUF6515 family protein n=1 Tax=Pseudomonas juntendi TaxID=2666183 RepID=A0A7W2QZW1_9PSED|nr:MULTISPECIES: DUF6515 family protein [Pseudomonas]QOH71719.1 hypothetical protein IGB31_04735 [Pseudomonas putida]MBA6133613.1 hypothetical protein [Pseudomonas juntendi]MBA6148962.1 hypothetical protein [Pseudomonas juntendi]MCK2110760.1 DUF6515 family protein [Pseudomonas juntendi]MDG9810633.1 DUF6515 family protein [Pseudomonas juntendi]